jgi:hypothetical protein
MKVTLYKFDTITGYWKVCRQHEIEDAEEWQRMYQRDDPKGYYYTSKKPPRFTPV